MKMLKKISRLPRSLKVVVWINIILVVVELVQTAFMAAQGHMDDLMTTILSIVLTILIIGGILQKSRFVRKLVLIVTWIGMVLLGFGLVAGLFTIGLPALVILFPLIIYGVTIWGLTTRQAKRYFRI